MEKTGWLLPKIYCIIFFLNLLNYNPLKIYIYFSTNTHTVFWFLLVFGFCVFGFFLHFLLLFLVGAAQLWFLVVVSHLWEMTFFRERKRETASEHQAQAPILCFIILPGLSLLHHSLLVFLTFLLAFAYIKEKSLESTRWISRQRTGKLDRWFMQILKGEF